MNINKFIVKYRYFFIIMFALITILCMFLIPKVTINYDLTSYLDDKTQTKQALQVLEDEFGESSIIYIIIEDETLEEIQIVTQKINTLDGVLFASFDTRNYCLDNEIYYGLIVVQIDSDNYSSSTAVTVGLIDENLTEYSVVYAGTYFYNLQLQRQVQKEMPLILLIALIIIFTILLFTSSSWIEPLLFGIIIFVSIIINLGTNLIFDNISYITQSVVAILQLALSMDYSIILLRKFENNKLLGMNTNDACLDAVKNSISSIFSSGTTTIAGLIALIFMTFTLGYDMGIVIAKGILISMITTILLLPSLIMSFDNLLTKTRKKKIIDFKGDKIAKFSLKGIKFIPALIILVVIASFAIQLTTVYSFSDETNYEQKNKLEGLFGSQTQIALLLPYSDNDDYYKAEQELITEIRLYDSRSLIKQINSITSSNAICYFDVNTFSTVLGIPYAKSTNLFTLFAENNLLNDNKIRSDVLIEFIKNLETMNLSNDEIALIYSAPSSLVEYISNDLNIEFVTIATINNYIYSLFTTDYSYTQMSLKMSINLNTIKYIYDSLIEESLTLFEVLNFINLNQAEMQNHEMSTNDIEFFSSYYIFLNNNTENYVNLISYYLNYLPNYESQIVLAKNGYLSENYAEIILTTNLENESIITSEYLLKLQELITLYFGENTSFIYSESMATLEISQTFSGDLLKITFFTILFIIIILLIAFKSFFIPILLVILIQGAIWITIATSVLFNNSIFFIAFLICMCIQMGATIDYAILITNEYVKNRKTLTKYESILLSMKNSLPTILTSGSIIVISSLIIHLISSNFSISAIGLILFKGTIFSMLMIIFVLPELLVITDKLIKKTTKNAKFIDENLEHNNSKI